MIITSPQNPRVLQAARLRDSRGRRQQNRIIIDGTREITRALQAGVVVLELFRCEGELSSDNQQVVTAAERRSATIFTLAPNVFAKIAFGDRNEGLIAVAQRPKCDLESVSVVDPSIVCVVDGIEKPGNLGAILRTADGAGATAVIATDPVCDIYHPNAIRASLGTVFNAPVCSTTASEAITWLLSHRFQIRTARLDAPLDYSETTYTARTAIVLGNEAKGLAPEVWKHAEIQPVAIPMRGLADSLNVSAAAAILLYHARQQTTQAGM